MAHFVRHAKCPECTKLGKDRDGNNNIYMHTSGDTHTYSLVAGTGDDDNAWFMISGTSLLTLGELDYETQHPMSIRVQTNDGNGGTFAKIFTININDVNDAPVVAANTGITLNEGATEAINTGELRVTDADLPARH